MTSEQIRKQRDAFIRFALADMGDAATALEELWCDRRISEQRFAKIKNLEAELSTLRARAEAAEAQRDALAGAARRAESVFRGYAALHTGKRTLEGDVKAKANQIEADVLAAALATLTKKAG